MARAEAAAFGNEWASINCRARSGGDGPGPLVPRNKHWPTILALWAKPQCGPVALAFIAACVFMTIVERQRSKGATPPVDVMLLIARSGARALLAFVTLPLVLLALMQLGSTLDEFTSEPWR